jgi:hypothetical protein
LEIGSRRARARKLALHDMKGVSVVALYAMFELFTLYMENKIYLCLTLH